MEAVATAEGHAAGALGPVAAAAGEAPTARELGPAATSAPEVEVSVGGVAPWRTRSLKE